MPETIIPVARADLSAAFPNNPKLVLAFEQLFRRNVDVAGALVTGAASTQALQDATVVTLSPNDSFANERVLAVQAGSNLNLTDTGTQVIIGMVSRFIAQGGTCTFDLDSDTEVSLPPDGRVFTSSAGPYADDAAAAAAGIAIGELYKKPAGVVVWRQV